jgi:ribosome-associated toxin RatA of RatAB toxin-antitoxin module
MSGTPVLPFEPSAIAGARGPLVHVELDSEGLPNFARAATRVAASPERVWEAVSNVPGYAERVPMIHRVRLDGDEATIDLRFRISLFAVGFSFEARAGGDAPHFIELRHLRGEPRDLEIRFDIVPLEDPSSSILMSSIGFDIRSLGWLVKFFLKHHPEIQYGVYPGSALALLDAMKRAAEERVGG